MKFIDWLFRFGIYRGVSVKSPTGLIECVTTNDGMRINYNTLINFDHGLSTWLNEECEGPWAIRMKRPFKLRKTYIAFARTTDAVIFRLLIP